MRIHWGPIACISLLFATIALGELQTRYDKIADRTEATTSIGPLGFRAYHDGKPGTASIGRCWITTSPALGARVVMFLKDEGLPTQTRRSHLLGNTIDLSTLAALCAGESLAFGVYSDTENRLHEHTLTPTELAELRQLACLASPSPTTAPSAP